MKQYKGAIFDLDGTLLDSMRVWDDIDVAFLKKRGLEVPPDYQEAITPLGFLEAARYTIRRFGFPETPEELIQEWHQMAVDAYTYEVELKDGAAEYLRYLKEKGIRLDGIPGFYRNRDGKWEASFYEGNKGYLCPVYSLNQKIKGFQIRVDHPVNKRKYIWFTSSGFEGGTSSGSPAGISGYISPVQKNIRVTEGILKAELASMRSGYPYIGIPGVGNYKSLQLVLMELKSRGLQTVYECMDMDKMMNLTCRCDCKEKCIWCEKPERLLKKQECSHKRRKRDTIRKGCLKLYEMCETMNLNCMRISWDTDEKGLWLGNYKGVDDWLYRKPPQEKERFS